MARDVLRDSDVQAGKASMVETSLISAADINKAYQHNGVRIEVLKGLAFGLGQGETLSIVGASGIGKSTLLHVLGTLDRPDDGRLEYLGRNVLALDDTQLARFRNRTIGFVFQFHHLLPEFTALENAMMPALIGGVDKKSAKEAAETILVRVGLKER
jgi:lipoprotein-releasing system ATP-binding protein